MLDGDTDNDRLLAWTCAHDSTHFSASGPAAADWGMAVPNGDSQPDGLLVWAMEMDALRWGAVRIGCMITIKKVRGGGGSEKESEAGSGEVHEVQSQVSNLRINS